MTEALSKQTWAQLAEDPQLKEKRNKLAKTVQVQMMEFKTNSPEKLAVCVMRLLNMFDNILTNPNDEKYRKVALSARSSLKTTPNKGFIHKMTCRSKPTMQSSEKTCWMPPSRPKSSS